MEKKNRQGWRSPNRLLDPPLIYAEKRRSETDLRKMVKIMGVVENQNKRKRYLLTCAITRKKGTKNKNKHLMNSDRFYFCVPT